MARTLLDIYDEMLRQQGRGASWFTTRNLAVTAAAVTASLAVAWVCLAA